MARRLPCGLAPTSSTHTPSLRDSQRKLRPCYKRGCARQAEARCHTSAGARRSQRRSHRTAAYEKAGIQQCAGLVGNMIQGASWWDGTTVQVQGGPPTGDRRQWAMECRASIGFGVWPEQQQQEAMQAGGVHSDAEWIQSGPLVTQCGRRGLMGPAKGAAGWLAGGSALRQPATGSKQARHAQWRSWRGALLTAGFVQTGSHQGWCGAASGSPPASTTGSPAPLAAPATPAGCPSCSAMGCPGGAAGPGAASSAATTSMASTPAPAA